MLTGLRRRAGLRGLQRPGFHLDCKRDIARVLGDGGPADRARGGAYREDAAGTDLINEIEDIAPGQSRDLTLDLDDARYALICNMVHREGGQVSAHDSLGMRTSLEVN